MILKIIGSILIIFGCGVCGYIISQNERYEAKLLRQLIAVLDYMQRELQFRLTALPALCRQAALVSKGPIGDVFKYLSEELEKQDSSTVPQCMERALGRVSKSIPLPIEHLKQLGDDLGRFDLTGQLQGLQYLRAECHSKLKKQLNGQDNRLRNYQTLCLCAGAAIVILFI